MAASDRDSPAGNGGAQHDQEHGIVVGHLLLVLTRVQSLGPPERLEDVVAVGIEAGDLEHGLDPALGAAAVEEDDDVDGLLRSDRAAR